MNELFIALIGVLLLFLFVIRSRDWLRAKNRKRSLLKKIKKGYFDKKLTVGLSRAKISSIEGTFRSSNASQGVLLDLAHALDRQPEEMKKVVASQFVLNYMDIKGRDFEFTSPLLNIDPISLEFYLSKSPDAEIYLNTISGEYYIDLAIIEKFSAS